MTACRDSHIATHFTQTEQYSCVLPTTQLEALQMIFSLPTFGFGFVWFLMVFFHLSNSHLFTQKSLCEDHCIVP